MKVNKNSIDISRAFLTFMALVGDVPKAAAALDMDPEVLRQLAKDEGWMEKIARVSLLSKSGKPGDHERGIHRALAFTQSHRLRLLLDKVLEEFDGKTAEEVMEALSTRTKSGATTISARFFSDLASAMEKAHHLGYLALGDTVVERPDTTTEEGEFSASAMHAAVISALNNPALRNVPPTKLLNDEQVTHVTHVDERKAPAESVSESGCIYPNGCMSPARLGDSAGKPHDGTTDR